MTIQAALVDPAWKVEITGVALAPVDHPAASPATALPRPLSWLRATAFSLPSR